MKRSKLLLVSGIIGALYVIYLISYFGIESGVAGVSGAGWPATAGALVRVGAVSKAGLEVGSAPCNPPPMGCQNLIAGPRGDCVARMPCGAWDGGLYLAWGIVAPAAL